MLKVEPDLIYELDNCVSAVNQILSIAGPDEAIRPLTFKRNVYPLAVWEPSKTSSKRVRQEALNILLNSETSRSGIGVGLSQEDNVVKDRHTQDVEVEVGDEDEDDLGPNDSHITVDSVSVES